MSFTTRDSGKREHFDSGMVRDTADGKPRYDLIPEPMLTRWAELMERGAKKYGENNWLFANSEAEMNRFRASAWRHFVAWSRGDTDEDHAVAVFYNISAYEYVRAKINAS